MSDLSTNLTALQRAIDGFGRHRRRWRCLEGAARFVELGPGALLLWFLADWAIGLPAWLLLGSFVLVLLLGLWALPQRALRPWFHRLRRHQEARLIESLHGEMDNLVIGALQLGEELQAAQAAARPLGHSPALVQALLERAVVHVQETDVRRLIDLRRSRRHLAAALLVLVAVAVTAVFAGAAVRERGRRLGDAYARALDALFPIEIEVTPGNRAVVRHSPVTLDVTVHGAHRKEVQLWRQTSAGGDEATGTPPGQARENDGWTATTLALVNGRAHLEVADVAESFAYRVVYGGQESATYRITAGDLPEISAISYELTFPAYTGQPPRTITGRLPTLQGLAGTTVLVSFAATTDLHPDACRAEWQNGPPQPVAVSGRFGHFAFTMDKPDRAAVHLTGSLGPEFKMPQPLGFEIRVTDDRPPAVRLRMKQEKLTLLAEQAAAFAFEYEAEDDYGVAETTMNYKIDCIDELLGRPVREGQRQLRLDPPQDRVRGTFAAMFKSLEPPLVPGDRVTFSVSAKDNNTETGPGLGRSRPVEIVVVAPDLAAFTEKRFGFGGHTLLSGLSRVKRQTNLLIEPDKAVRTEVQRAFEKHDLKTQVAQEGWPSGSEDSVGQYFQILSGGK